METKQIISWLRDKADRGPNHSWTRMLNMAADRLCVLENRLEQSNAERDIVTKRMVELEVSSSAKKDKASNGDRIRNMTDAQLALFLVRLTDLDDSIPYCTNKPECKKLLDEDGITQEMCMECMEKWIRKEVHNG